MLPATILPYSCLLPRPDTEEYLLGAFHFKEHLNFANCVLSLNQGLPVGFLKLDLL